jgi:transcriptional regulator with XRE-family HTH domain
MAKDPHLEWAAAVRRWMAEAEMSQAKVAQKLGSTGATVSRVLKGTQRSRDVIEGISELAGIAAPPGEGVDDEDAEILMLCRDLRALDREAYDDIKARVARYVQSRKELLP